MILKQDAYKERMYANNAWEWILKDNLPSEGLGKKVTEYRKIPIKIEPEREK